MRKMSVLVLVAGAVALSGCGISSLVNRVRPDEFAVQRATPLVVPPDFALTPPQPGAPRPNTTSGQQATLDAMFGGPAQRSDVERAAATRSGTPDAAIRSTVGDPQTNTAAKADVTRDILAAPSVDGEKAQAHIGG